MNYLQLRPSPAVAQFVEFYWILEDRTPESFVQRIVPDGRSGIILNFANPFESFTGGNWRSQPECFFVGQITGPLLLRPSGPAAMLGIQFHPHGAARLLPGNMSELTDSAVALEDLSRQLYRQLEWVRGLPPLKAAAEIDSVLCAFAKRAGCADDPIAYAINAIESSSGLVSIKVVSERLGWSSRQLQRRFKHTVGISPKLFGRMQRLQGVFRAMENSTTDWVNTAIYCGYYDQAHLIRDFREFAGTTPSSLLGPEMDLSRRFVHSSPMSHLYKTAP